MDLYIVRGKAFVGKYIEQIECLDGMDETPKCYVGLGKKIHKNKINQLENGTTIGSFQMIVTDKENINEARKQIKERVYQYNLKEFQRYQEAVKAIQEHDLSQEVKIRN